MSLPAICVRLAFAGGLLCACHLDGSSSDDDPGDAAATEASTSFPPTSPQSKPTTDASAQVDPDAAGVTDAGAAVSDAGAKPTDAGVDAKPDTGALLPNGSPCTLPTQCAGLLCLPFKGKGLRCTKACTKDSECPNNENCRDDPAVCEI